MLAPIVLGALGKQKREQGMSVSDLTGYLQRERKVVQEKAPNEMNLLGQLFDQDGDGDFDIGDVAKLGMGFLSKKK